MGHAEPWAELDEPIEMERNGCELRGSQPIQSLLDLRLELQIRVISEMVSAPSTTSGGGDGLSCSKGRAPGGGIRTCDLTLAISPVGC